MALNIISLNVNGLRENKKRFALYNWLRKQNVDICLLQETHCCDQNEMNNWTKEWGGKTFWSAGSQASRGGCMFD